MVILCESLRSSSSSSPKEEDSNQNQLQIDVIRERNFKQNGVIVGITFIIGTLGIGIQTGIFDFNTIVIPFGIGLIGFGLYTLSYNEYDLPLPSNNFEIKESTIPEAGKGLFTTKEIPKDTFLFKYQGEILSEEEYFLRYPNGDGRYVAVISTTLFGEPVYIDGQETTQYLARYMNSKPTNPNPSSSSSETTENDNHNKDDDDQYANVRWKKQRYGSQSGSMYFYTIRNIKPNEELTFDYGSDYWIPANNIVLYDDEAKEED